MGGFVDFVDRGQRLHARTPSRSFVCWHSFCVSVKTFLLRIRPFQLSPSSRCCALSVGFATHFRTGFCDGLNVIKDWLNNGDCVAHIIKICVCIYIFHVFVYCYLNTCCVECIFRRRGGVVACLFVREFQISYLRLCDAMRKSSTAMLWWGGHQHQ